MTTKTTKHGVQTSKITENRRAEPPTLEEMERLHDDHEIGFTPPGQPSGHRAKRSNPSGDARDNETGRTHQTMESNSGVIAIFLGYMIGSATVKNMNNIKDNPEPLRTTQR